MSGDDDLVRRAQAGETDAFCLLAQAHARRIYSLALHYCRHPQDAEDLSQEVWLRAFAALSTFRHESTFYTWLRKITINCFLNHQRLRTGKAFDPASTLRAVNLESSVTESRCCSENLESAFNNRILADQVIQALAELSPQQRLVFLLKHKEGMTYQEIAEALNTSTGAVKKTLFRTMTKLRRRFGSAQPANNYVPCAATEY